MSVTKQTIIKRARMNLANKQNFCNFISCCVVTCFGMFLLFTWFNEMEAASFGQDIEGPGYNHIKKDCRNSNVLLYMSLNIYAYIGHMLLYFLTVCVVTKDQKNWTFILGVIAIIMLNLVNTFCDYCFELNIQILILGMGLQSCTIMLMLIVHLKGITIKHTFKPVKVALTETMAV